MQENMSSSAQGDCANGVSMRASLPCAETFISALRDARYNRYDMLGCLYSHRPCKNTVLLQKSQCHVIE